MPEQYYPPELVEQITKLMEPELLADFLRVCQLAREAGNGFYQVNLEFKYGTLDTIHGGFTSKPRLGAVAAPIKKIT